MTNKKRINILNITLIAVFAACAFVAVWIQIPLPAAVGTPFLHLGNLVVILVSLLFGPIIGAASGAIGMGLYDIIKGYGIWSIKTIVLKFGIGLVVGFIYLFIKKKTSKSLIKVMYVSSIIFLFISLITFGLRIFVGKEFFLEILNKNINIDWTLYTFTFIIGLSLLISAIFTKKINRSVQLALLASTFGVFFNIIGEFLGKVIKQLLISSPLNVALIQAAISIPATIINGTISIVAIIFVFAPLKKAIGKVKNDKKYEILLIDADDTILDFKKSSQNAIAYILNKYNVDVTKENIEMYEKLNLEEWRRFESKKVEKQVMLEERFVKYFKKFNIDVDGKLVNKEYLEKLAENTYEVIDAYNMCERLSKNYQLYIITNGEKNTQEKRFSQTNITKFFQDVFVSENIGYAKPSKEYFDFVIDKIGENDLSKYLIIGDSLTSDIIGGINYGIDTCWFNPLDKKTNIKITYEVNALKEVLDLLIEE